MVTRKDIEAEAAWVQDLIQRSTPVIPSRLQHRPRDRRGYVIPFAQFIDKNGEPQFKIMDDELVLRCLNHRLCSLCGGPLGRHIFFIGGPKCVENGYFYDPPMHRECAEYAMRTCPHIVHAKGKYGRVPEPEVVGATLGIGAAAAATQFALMHGERYTYGRVESGMMLIKAALPWQEVVWYYQGVGL
jgi:hypothetical protein